MAIETERKFLIKGEFRHLAVKKIEILQAYLTAAPDKTIRLRITDETAFLTVKTKAKRDSISRHEWEVEIPVKDAWEMMEICIPGRVVKTRYHVPAGKHTFEVDVFHEKNEGLIVAEIELDSDNEYFDRPEWLGEEVTGNPAYFNSNLTK
jgi:adenylate cyclase